MKQAQWVCVILASSSLFVGCEPSSNLCMVSGTVSWNGTPVESGFITFIPLDGAAAQAGEIHHGRFDFEAAPGKCRVEIQANKESGFNKSMNQPNIVQYLPAEFNTKSTLTKEVLPRRENSFDFQLIGNK